MADGLSFTKERVPLSALEKFPNSGRVRMSYCEAATTSTQPQPPLPPPASIPRVSELMANFSSRLCVRFTVVRLERPENVLAANSEMTLKSARI